MLFSKRPIRGRVKTRLVPPLTAAEALALHRAFLVDGFARARSMIARGRAAEVCLDGPPALRGELRAAARHVPVTLQGEGDLGARLARAFARASEDGVERTIVVGADAPTLPDRLVETAYAALRDGADAVVVPSNDGGYVLVGASAAAPELFDGIPWGTPGVLEATRAAARRRRTSLVEIESWYDVDAASDLARLARDVADAASAARAPRTAALLRKLAPEW